MYVFGFLGAMYFLTGSCLGTIILTSYERLPPLNVLLVCVIMIGIGFTAIVSLAASPLVYMLYLGPNLASWAFVAFAHPLPGLEHLVQGAVIIYSVVLVITVRSVHRSLRNNILLRLKLTASLGELRDTQAKLVEASRQAGRSDVATAVLHNVGNVLNSVNVSALLVNELITNTRLAGLSKIATLLGQHREDLGGFFRDDHRGQKLPEYFAQLHGVLEQDNASAVTELQSLMRNIDHIKVIVQSQQSHVTEGGAVETFDVHALLDDALKFSVASRDQDAIEIVRRFDPLPPASLDRHKALQILMNLLTNARDAVMTRDAGGRRIVVHARRGAHGELEIAVEDNGCGVEPQHLDQIFRLGFTTKSAGHGLGLHYSACAARELRGNLTARSPGAGSGASFLLTLPLDAASAPLLPRVE
jgi:signal transduction histidine kinase